MLKAGKPPYRTLRSHLNALPKGHKDRAPLDNLVALPEYLKTYIDAFNAVAPHRRGGWNGPEPLLDTLDAYDRRLRIDRDPEETEVLLMLDLIERSERAKRSDT